MYHLSQQLILVWDATCSDTYAPSHLAQSTLAAGAVASQAEDLKKIKYSYLDGHPGICFTPIAYESSGVVGPLSQIFLKELGHRLSATTGDTKSYSYLLQRLSVAVQRGNAASILGTLILLIFKVIIIVKINVHLLLFMYCFKKKKFPIKKIK